jgi:hypothetical protein
MYRVQLCHLLLCLVVWQLDPGFEFDRYRSQLLAGHSRHLHLAVYQLYCYAIQLSRSVQISYRLSVRTSLLPSNLVESR